MNRTEPPMTRWYWEQIGGTLIEEFCVVPAGKGQGRRAVDGLILPDGKHERLPPGTSLDISGRDVVVVQTKSRRLGMNLMGQTLFSAELVQKRFSPRSVIAVALCRASDAVLQPLLEAHQGCKVVVCPSDVTG